MIKMFNGIMRTWSWWKGFVAGIVMFTAAAMVCIMVDDRFVIRSTEKGKKKYKF